MSLYSYDNLFHHRNINYFHRGIVTYVKGTLLVGYSGTLQKIPVEIDSDNVADVLQIRPHTLVSEKESDNYETGVKPGKVK